MRKKIFNLTVCFSTHFTSFSFFIVRFYCGVIRQASFIFRGIRHRLYRCLHRSSFLGNNLRNADYYTLEEICEQSERLQNRLGQLTITNEKMHMRQVFLEKQLLALQTKTKLLLGEYYTFDEESFFYLTVRLLFMIQAYLKHLFYS